MTPHLTILIASWNNKLNSGLLNKITSQGRRHEHSLPCHYQVPDFQWRYGHANQVATAGCGPLVFSWLVRTRFPVHRWWRRLPELWPIGTVPLDKWFSLSAGT